MILYLLLSNHQPFNSSGRENDDEQMRENILGGKYEFDPLYWNGISDEAISLIRTMLIVDPKERINSDEIVQSSWFTHTHSAVAIDFNCLKDENNRLLIEVIRFLFFFFFKRYLFVECW